VKFTCKICANDQLTHLCPKILKAMRILSLLPTMMIHPFSHNQHMASSSSNEKNVVSGSKNPPTQDGDRFCINMVKYEVNAATRSHDYISPQTIPGLESPPPPKMPLQIEKPKPPPRIPK
jgi:hypothetical protein